MTTYHTMAEYMASVFHRRMQKIAVNASLGCPNRDGKLSTSGCVYCNNAAFNPAYAFKSGLSISNQLESGMNFFRRKGEATGYLAYFQSFSNTYGPTQKLISLYEEAIHFHDISGLVIATRPDCLQNDLLDYFQNRFGNSAPDGHPYLLVEIGVESTNDNTLKRINRGHSFSCAANAIIELHKRGIPSGVHIILGLPGESEWDYIQHARHISDLPVSTIKLHQLQIIRDTPLADEYLQKPDEFSFFTPQSYASAVVTFLQELREDIYIDRFVSEAPADMVLAPRWGIKPYKIQRMVNSLLLNNHTSSTSGSKSE